MTSPDSGSNWNVGTPHTIQWVSPAGVSTHNLELSYSTDSFVSSTYVTTVVNSGSSNSWTWPSVPNRLSSNVKVKVRDLVNSSYQGVSETFSIILPTIALTSPNGSENWVKSSLHDITWDTTGGAISGNLALLYSRDNFVSDSTVIDTIVPNSGIYQGWTVPNLSYNASFPPYRIKVKIRDDSSAGNYGTLLSDNSDNYWEASPSSLTLYCIRRMAERYGGWVKRGG